MKLKNNFSTKTRELFIYCYECWWCGQNRWDAIHHILGRISSSPLNAAPVHNLKCHVGNASLDSFEFRSKSLKKTYAYLLEIGYELNDEDIQFLKKYSKYYK